jgi:hypothetical protein
MVRSIMLRASAVLAVVLTAGVVLAVTGPSATATQGQPVIAGFINDATMTTYIHNTAAGDGLEGDGGRVGVRGRGGTEGVHGTGSTYGVYGTGETYGVFGETSNAAASGVYGSNSAAGNGVSGVAPTGNGVYGNGGLYGIYGESTGTAVLGNNTGSGNGVWGLANNSHNAVVGEQQGSGAGVLGEADTNGVGVFATSANGTALQVLGRPKFSTAGTAAIASGKKSVTVTLAGVTTSDFVLATVQGSGAFYVKNASAGSGKFTITINKAPTAPVTVKVAYFVISAS